VPVHASWSALAIRALVAIFAVVLIAQTTASAETAQAPSSIALSLFASGLRGPVFAVADPGGRPDRLYVVERAGRIRIVEPGRVLSQAFLDIRSRVRSGGLRGLFSLAFHPRYPSNGRFFVNYVGRGGDIYVDEFRSRRGLGLPLSRRMVLRVETEDTRPYSHFGGQLAFGPDRGLYASFGDSNLGPAAQDPNTFLGKLVRLDVDEPVSPPRIVAYGLRNPWRFSFDRAKGDVYIGDPGDRLREEINFLPSGFEGVANFGWDVYEGSILRRPLVSMPGQLRAPMIEYRHKGKRCWSVTGGYVYRGRRLIELLGRYLYGDLCGGVWSVRSRRGKAIDRRAERLFPGTLASFAEGADGELYAVNLTGTIIAIVPS
jgi:glucose/arabinose dehydrogenase